MIKDKITQELKSRFLQEIRKTMDTGKERGFLICKDEKDRLSATKSCEGEECIVVLSSLKSQCNFKIQGDFHTHPHAKDVKEYVEEKLGRRVSLEEAKNVIKDMAKTKNVSLAEPSYGDVLGAMRLKYTGSTLGTTCTGTDIELNKVECWSAKNKITEEYFDIATRELNSSNINRPPLEWTRRLFDKEIIDLE